jgi:diacylglycerol kinase family enzyme
MRLHLVVNPVAGRNRAAPLAAAVAARLEALGAEADVFFTRGPGDAARHVAALTPDACERLVVVGGDGTLREVVNARPLPLPWPVGLVPMGTANVVGRELGMPLGSDEERHARALLAALPWRVGVLELERPGRPRELAVANVGAGLDAAIVRAVAAERTRRAGLGGYAVWVRPILASVRVWAFPPLTVRLDGGRALEARAVVVQGAHSYGGLFELAPDAALDADLLRVSLIDAPTRRDLLRLLARAAVRHASRDHHLHTFRARTVTIEAAAPLPLQADGDPAGDTPLTVTLRRDALTLLRVPPAE